MLHLRLELALLCRACEAPVPLGAVMPTATCDRCHREAALPADLWQQLLHQAVADAPAMPEQDERDSFVQSAAGTIRRVYRRVAAPPDGLGARIIPEVAPAHVTFLGETLATPEIVAREALQRACPECGAPLSLSGAGPDSIVRCEYCRTESALPKEPSPTALRPFYLAVDAAPSESAAAFAWTRVDDALADRDGHVYCVGEIDGERGAWSFDAQLRLRWVKRGVRGTRLVLSGRTLIARAPDAPHALMLAADDGRVLRASAGIERALASAGALGSGGEDSILVAHLGHVTRFGLDGRERETSESIEMQEGWLLQGTPHGGVARLARPVVAGDWQVDVWELGSGTPEHLWTCAMPGFTGQRQLGQAAGFASLAAFVAVPRWMTVGPRGGVVAFHGDVSRPSLSLASAGGAVTLVKGRAQGGPLVPGDAPRMAILPNSELWLFHGRGCARKLAADGRVLWSNAPALASDRDARQTL